MTSIRSVVRRRASLLGAMGLVLGGVVAVAPPSEAASSSSAWTMFGQNLNNTASTASTISTNNVGALKKKWAFTTGGDVSARAAVANGVAYVPDWSGHLYAIKAGSGKLVWSKNILTDYLGDVAFDPAPTKVVSRTSPALDVGTNTLYVGTQRGAYLLAINASTGALRWRTQLDAHALAIDTASPAVYNGNVYVGVASLEEAASTDPNYPCCSFRGSVMSLNAATGAVNWKFYTVPSGYNGGAVWGSTVVPDPARGYVYATTGNNYFTPTDPAYTTCIQAGGSQKSCNSPDDHLDSVLALNLSTGALVWSRRFADADDWNVACFFQGVNCPVNAGPDFDFGSGVQLMTIQTAHGPQSVIGAGQKSGVYSELDPATGAVLWATQVGPGSSLGGMEWGSATDGKRIYVQIANFYGTGYPVNGTTVHAGSFAALDPVDGHIIWQLADPNDAVDLGPMTVANGVVYAPSMGGGATDKNMFALDAATGAIRWSFASGASVNAGAVVANDTVFWGSGYSNLGIPGYTPNNKLYAFSLGGQ